MILRISTLPKANRLMFVLASAIILGGVHECRREMRAALHKLQQRLGQGHNCLSVVQPVVKADPAESKESRMRGRLFPSLRGIYTIFTTCGLL